MPQRKILIDVKKTNTKSNEINFEDLNNWQKSVGCKLLNQRKNVIKVTVAKPTKGEKNQLFEEKVHLQNYTGRKMTQKKHTEKWVKMTLYFSLECLIIKKYI